MSSVFDRLYDTRSYTGVYAERFKGQDGRINADTDLSARSPGAMYRGNTNTGTDAVIHDISQIMRPNLRMGAVPTHMSASAREQQRRNAKGLSTASSARAPVTPTGARRFNSQLGMWTDEYGSPANAPHQQAPPEVDQMDTAEQLRYIFHFYCAFGRTGGKGAAQDTIDSSQFMKFCRECPKLIDRRLNRTEIDLIFTKAKPKFERRLDFTHFLDALSAMAQKKYPKYDPTTAFSVLLAHHVFKVPVAPGSAKRQAQYPQQKPRPAPRTPQSDVYSGHEEHYKESAANLARQQKRIMEDELLAKQNAAKSYGPGNATIAGSANKPGGIYDRLSSPQTYTGVYRRRFEGDGRINAHTDLTASSTSFKGNTNTRTDETFHDVKGMLRTNLKTGGSRMMRF
eukprot:g4249.t1